MKTEETNKNSVAVVTPETNGNLVAAKDSFVSYDLKQELPDLTIGKALPIDLASNYWTPEKEKESKRVFFVKVTDAPHTRMNNEGVMQTNILPTVFFIEQVKVDGIIELNSVMNASKKLVGLFDKQNIPEGSPFIVRYEGKRKNKTNANFSDCWSVKPLIINI